MEPPRGGLVCPAPPAVNATGSLDLWTLALSPRPSASAERRNGSSSSRSHYYRLDRPRPFAGVDLGRVGSELCGVVPTPAACQRPPLQLGPVQTMARVAKAQQRLHDD